MQTYWPGKSPLLPLSSSSINCRLIAQNNPFPPVSGLIYMLARKFKPFLGM
jgi:hypothetical protein